MPLRLNPTFRDRLAGAGRPLIGGWVCSGSAVAAEIMAGAGLDWVLVDMEHGPNTLSSTLAQLQAMAAYPVTAVVRTPSGDPVTIKQVLDLGAENLIVPMVSTAEEAARVAAAAQYPSAGVRGVGSALARSARWGRVDGYLTSAADHVSLIVQIETGEAVENAGAIAATPGVDGVLVGPSDLAASLGLLGQQAHADVVAAVKKVFADVAAAGKFVGVNAFDPAVARDYMADGAHFALVGADVTLLARASEKLAADFIPS